MIINIQYQADLTHIRRSYGYEPPEHFERGIAELARIIQQG
jgi:hypothetical protein